MSWSSCSGAQLRAAVATSQAALPGPARSKSISATARPSRNTRLAGCTSLWLTRPRLAVPPGNGPLRDSDSPPDSRPLPDSDSPSDLGPSERAPSASSVCGLAPAGRPVSKAEQGAGETRVGDQAMDHISSDRGAYRRALGDAIGDGQDKRDPLEHRAWRHDHAAVQRGRNGPAVLADEHPGHLAAHP